MTYLREAPAQTVSDLFDLIAPPLNQLCVQTDDISVDLTQGSVIKVRDQKESKTIELRATYGGIEALGNWLDIPSKFLGRIDQDVQENLLNALLSRTTTEPVIGYTSTDELSEVVPSNSRNLDPRRVIEVASQVLGEDAPVIEYRRDAGGYGFDVTVPYGEGRTKCVGGDRKVGDITAGGLRFGQDTKHNLAPYVQSYLYRLLCTNGMEVPDRGLRIDARGKDLDGIVESLREKSYEALIKVDSQIAHFYDLRNSRLTNPERTLVRLAAENGLSDRTLATLLENLREFLDETGAATMFDIVNLVTNYANSPALAPRFQARRALEVVGGNTVFDHAERCATCNSRLGR